LNNRSSSNAEKQRYNVKELLFDLNGALTALLMVLNTVFWLPLILTAIIFKFIPTDYTKKLANSILNFLVTTWISVNSLILDLTKNIRWNVSGLDNLSMKKNYLVLSNHQSWSDIVILQKLLNRKVPMLRFFY
jgi:1-acyl-sn-glycerol-3-phosphate acyltransferase